VYPEMGKKNSLESISCHLEPGKKATEAIYKILGSNGTHVNQVTVMSFDTASLNTEHLNGICTLLETKDWTMLTMVGTPSS